MLVSLRIRNFVLMDDCSIEWKPGFTVLTGETGAGKSVIISALGLLLGERGSSEQLRNPDEEALLEAVFDIDPETQAAQTIHTLLDEAGLPGDEDVLILTRRIAPNGRSRLFINNSSCLLKTLQSLGQLLVDLHGQHEHQSLLHRSGYLLLLDQFGKHDERLGEYRRVFTEWRDTRQQLDALNQDERERILQQDLLQQQLQMIDEAALSPGEDEDVEARVKVMQHAERLAESARDIVEQLDEQRSGQPGMVDELQRMDDVLQSMTELDGSLKPIAEAFQPAVIALQESARELEAYLGSLEFDANELDTLQQRRYQIRELQSRFGSTIEEILGYAEETRETLDRMENVDEERARLEEQRSALEASLVSAARALHDQRSTSAKTIVKQVNRELKTLGMKDARFTINVNYQLRKEENREVAFSANGADDIEFLISTIPGKPPRSLHEIASGGEISRVMLALKCTFAQVDPVPVMIFDEIDVGVGGETADAIAERIVELARHKQVICITHLPQLASRAAHNQKVEKETSKGGALSTVRDLTGKAREVELARMLGDANSTESKRYARAMLKSAAS